MSRSLQHLSFCDWLISLSIISSRFIQDSACVNFLFRANIHLLPFWLLSSLTSFPLLVPSIFEYYRTLIVIPASYQFTHWSSTILSMPMASTTTNMLMTPNLYLQPTFLFWDPGWLEVLQTTPSNAAYSQTNSSPPNQKSFSPILCISVNGTTIQPVDNVQAELLFCPLPQHHCHLIFVILLWFLPGEPPYSSRPVQVLQVCF